MLVSQEILQSELKLFDFSDAAIDLIQSWSSFQLEEAGLGEESKDRFVEFHCLGAAEATAINNVTGVTIGERLPGPLIVDTKEAVISVLKDDTGLGGGCAEMKRRIARGKLETGDLFLFGGDAQKWKEYNVKIETLLENPFEVAEKFHPTVPGFPSAHVYLGLQALVWKLKQEIVGFNKRESFKMAKWQTVTDWAKAHGP